MNRQQIETHRAMYGRDPILPGTVAACAEEHDLIDVDQHAHDSRPGSWCVVLADPSKPRARIHVNRDGHALTWSQLTLWHSHRRDDLAVAHGAADAAAMARAMLSPGWVGACDYCGALAAETIRQQRTDGQRRTIRRCQRHAVDLSTSRFWRGESS